MATVSPLFDVPGAMAALRESPTPPQPPGDVVCTPSGNATPARLRRTDERPALGELPSPARKTPLQRYKIQRQKKLSEMHPSLTRLPLQSPSAPVAKLQFGPMGFDSPQLRSQQQWLSESGNAIKTPSVQGTIPEQHFADLTPVPGAPSPFRAVSPTNAPALTPVQKSSHQSASSPPPTPANPEPAALESFFRARSAHINSPIFRRRPVVDRSDYVLNTPTVRANPLAISPTSQAQLPEGIECELLEEIDFSLDFGFDRTFSVDLRSRAVRVPLPYAVKVVLSDHHGSIRPISARLEPNRDFDASVLIDVIGSRVKFDRIHDVSDSEDVGKPQGSADVGDGADEELFECEDLVLMFWAAPDTLDDDGYAKLLIFVMDEDGEEHETELELFVRGKAPVIAVEGPGALAQSKRSETDVNFESGQNFSEETVKVWNETPGDSPLFVNVLLIDSGGGAFSIGMDSEDIRPCIPMIIPANSYSSFTCRFELPGDATPGKEDGLYFGNAIIKLAALFRKVSDPSHDDDLDHFYDHVVNFHTSRKSRPPLLPPTPTAEEGEEVTGLTAEPEEQSVSTASDEHDETPLPDSNTDNPQSVQQEPNVDLTPSTDRRATVTSDPHFSSPTYNEDNDALDDDYYQSSGSEVGAADATFTDFVPIFRRSSVRASAENDGDIDDSTWLGADVSIQNSPKWVDNVQPPLHTLAIVDEDDDSDRGEPLPLETSASDKPDQSIPEEPSATARRSSAPTSMSYEEKWNAQDANRSRMLYAEDPEDAFQEQGHWELWKTGSQPMAQSVTLPTDHEPSDVNNDTLAYISTPKQAVKEPVIPKEARPKLRMPRSVHQEGVQIISSSGFAVLPLYNACAMNLEVSLAVKNLWGSSAAASIDPEFIVLGPNSRTDVLVNRCSGAGGDLVVMAKCTGTKAPYVTTTYRLPLKIETSKRRVRAPFGFVVDRPTMSFYNPQESDRNCRLRILNGTNRRVPFATWLGAPSCPVEERSGGLSVFTIATPEEGFIDAQTCLFVDVLFEGRRELAHYWDELSICIDGRTDSIPLFGYCGGSDVRFEYRANGRVRARNHGTRSGFIVVTGPDHDAMDNQVEKAILAPQETVEFVLPYGSGSEMYTGDEIARSRMCMALELSGGVFELNEDGGLFGGWFEGQDRAAENEGLDWGNDGKHSLHYAGRLMDGTTRKFGISAELGKVIAMPNSGVSDDKMWQASVDMKGYVYLENFDSSAELEFEARGAEPGSGIVPALGDAKLAAFSDSVRVTARGRTVALSLFQVQG